MKALPQQVATAIAQCLTWKSDLSFEAVTQDLQAAADILHNPFDTLKTTNALKAFADRYPTLRDYKIGLVYGGATKIKQYVFESTDLQEIRGASALLDRINLVDLPAFFRGEQVGDRFLQCRQAASYCERVRSGWLEQNFPGLADALTPEMVIYSTGGNILAFCPEKLVDDLADAIEKRYTVETLTANACAVGDSFYPLEIYLGLLKDPIGTTPWLDTVQANQSNVAMQAYFGFSHDADTQAVEAAFRQQKGFSELLGKLANQFNQRRSGYDNPDSLRPSRRYPPMFETHPYVMRDDSDRRSLVLDLNPASVLKNNPERSSDKLLPEEVLPDNPKFSEPSARKRWVGQVTKRENSRWRAWYRKTELLKDWNPIQVLDDELKAQGKEPKTDEELKKREDLFRVGLSSWVNRFEQFLFENGMIDRYDLEHGIFAQDQATDDGRPNILGYYTREARSLTEIGAASDGFVAYIYADGNNMGAYIRDRIKTPEDYERFSQDVFKATEQSVYWALAHHVHPYEYTPDAKSSRDNKDPVWIHPFEIITIGGDDVLLIVPANKALEVARAIGEEFEQLLSQWHLEIPLEEFEQRLTEDCNPYMVETSYDPGCVHRNSRQAPFCSIRQNQLSISSGVLITAENTPIYYADKLVSQLLKSAKKKAKDLKKKAYFGGTVDFLTLKAVTMISSNIEAFRQEGLTVRFKDRQQELKLYAAPYTLHELGGLIKTVQAVKQAGFPKSQLYQVRSLLERGKRTAILNYRYFRVRLQRERDRTLMTQEFEAAWCKPLDPDNPGSLAPWMTVQSRTSGQREDPTHAANSETAIYETLWRELVELYPFILLPEDNAPDLEPPPDIPQSANTGETAR
jgi:CRISPR-associated protein Cmr2